MASKNNNEEASFQVTLVVDPNQVNVAEFITNLPDGSEVRMKNGDMNIILDIEDALEAVESMTSDGGSIAQFEYNRNTKTISVA